MGAAKYFVWGEGVWRELDLASGRVCGWRRRARFVFVRRGRLHVARRRAVLRALQALSAGQPSAAADGPRLSHRSKSVAVSTPAPAPPPAPVALDRACQHHHCCAHYNGCHTFSTKEVDTSTATASFFLQQKREAAVQCGGSKTATSIERGHAITINLKNTAYRNGINRSSSGDEFVSTPIKRKLDEQYSNRTEVNVLLGKHVKVKTSPVKTKKIVGSSSDTTSKASEMTKAKVKPRSEKKTDTWTDEQVRINNIATTSTHDKHDECNGDGPGAVRKELIIPESDVAALRGFVARTRASAVARFDADDAYKRALFYAINPLVELERCARLERALLERHEHALPHFAARLGLAPATDVDRSTATPSPRAPRRRTPRHVHYREQSSSDDTNKENKVDTRRSSSHVRSERTMPNVVEDDAEVIEPRTTRTSSARLGASELTNKEKTVAFEPARTSRTTRTRRGVSERGNKEECKSTGSAKTTLTSRPVRNEKEVSAAEPPRMTRASGVRAGVSVPGNKAVSDDSEEPTTSKQAKQSSVPAHTISKRPSASGGKEYSNLEDHAIVAWVSSGARARHVNGNRLWRELQEQYERLTGRSRSWHSVRNRYLRYILPSLGALGLPPATVSRLRAAAATGAIKSKKRSMGGERRASIFKEEELRGASSRRVRAPPSPPAPPSDHDTHDDSNGPSSVRRSLRSPRPLRSPAARINKRLARSPRYSEVTRRFAARHRHSSSSASSPTSPTQPTRPTQPTSPTTAHVARRLFNPNIKF